MEGNISTDGSDVISNVNTGVSGDIDTTMPDTKVSQELQAKQTNTERKADTVDESDVNRLYTRLSVAKKEIWKRWENEDLKREVEKFLGKDILKEFESGPTAALFRFIATPNLEYSLAQNMASLLNLKFVFMEFLNDKFCTRNNDKTHLGKMSFFKDKAKKHLETGSRVKVIDLVQSEGIPFKSLKTTHGKSFVEFHHDLFRLQGDAIKTFDVSRFKTNGETASEVYMKVFSLFVCHGILFENYFIHTSDDERRFTHEVIIPTFEAVYRKFGVHPLIVPIVSNEDEDASWQFYPDYFSKHLSAQLSF